MEVWYTPTSPAPSLNPWGYSPRVILTILNKMENNLKFLDTLTVEQFKSAMRVEKIQVKQNPKTGKLFFTYGAKVGAVARKGVPTNPMVSLVQGDATPENPSGQFYLLHDEGEGGAPVIATF